MKTGDRIRVCACKTDGTIYRGWHARIESLDSRSLVTIAPAGDPVDDLLRGRIVNEHSLRAYYWFDRLYNLIEVFKANGDLVRIYINLASLPQIIDGGMRFTDHELDVVKDAPAQARLVDEDEFAEAVIKYGYSEDFQRKILAAAREALELADNWQAKPAPFFGGTHA